MILKIKYSKEEIYEEKKSRMIALALAAVMALTACSSNSDSPAASEADKTTAAGQEADSTSGTEAGTPASINDNGEKVLRIGTYMPVTTLVPWKTTSDGDGYIIRQIYHTLLEMNKQSEFARALPNPGNAARMEKFGHST